MLGSSIDIPHFPAKSIQMDDTDLFRSPFTRMQNSNKSYGDLAMGDTDISFISSARPSTDRMNSMLEHDMILSIRQSLASEDGRLSSGSPRSNPRSSNSTESGNFLWSESQTMV